jgi:phosphate transport system protein
MERHFDEELNLLKEQMMKMGTRALLMIRNAVDALYGNDKDLIRKVTENENEINRLHVENDEKAIRLLALYQPAARDLRTISAIMKINGELERIADQAVNVSQTTFYHIMKNEPGKIPPELRHLADVATDMLEKSMKAFSHMDAALARAVLLEDNEADKIKRETFDNMIDAIKTDPANAEKYVDCILICRNLEKIADHCTNIAEDVIFMILGKDIRHHAEGK